MGDHNINDNINTIVDIQRINDDPNYNDQTLVSDFSILTLSNPVTFSNTIRPVCLPKDKNQQYVGNVATVSGWGTLSEGGVQPSHLMEVNVTVTTQQV